MSKKLLKEIISNLDDNKAKDITSIPLEGKSDIADHLVIATGTSSRHVSSLAQRIVNNLKGDRSTICMKESKSYNGIKKQNIKTLCCADEETIEDVHDRECLNCPEGFTTRIATWSNPNQSSSQL